MSQKVIWGVIVAAIIVGLLWWAGIIPGVSAGSQGAAAANANNAGVAPSSVGVVNITNKAAADIKAAGSDSAKLTAAAAEVAGAVAALDVIVPKLSLAVSVAAAKGNNMDAAIAAMKDASNRLAALKGVAITASNASNISNSLVAIIADISAANTALNSVKLK